MEISGNSFSAVLKRMELVPLPDTVKGSIAIPDVLVPQPKKQEGK